jgi:hypothetical protein
MLEVPSQNGAATAEGITSSYELLFKDLIGIVTNAVSR